MRVCVLTASDRSARGERPDLSGPILKEIIQEQGWTLQGEAVLPDDQEGLANQMIAWCDAGDVDLILTTGGTGFAPRDQVPEATLSVVERLAPGIAEVMRFSSLRKTPHAMLSRAQAGIRGKTLIVNLPGSPRAARENLESILPVLPHAVDLMQDEPRAETGHQFHPPQLST